MGNDYAEELQDMEERAARLLEGAHGLPPGPERHGLIEEVRQFKARLSALKAKSK